MAKLRRLARSARAFLAYAWQRLTHSGVRSAARYIRTPHGEYHVCKNCGENDGRTR